MNLHYGTCTPSVDLAAFLRQWERRRAESRNRVCNINIYLVRVFPRQGYCVLIRAGCGPRETVASYFTTLLRVQYTPPTPRNFDNNM